MKKIGVLIITIVGLLGGLASCDKVEFPVVFESELDTTLYPGNYFDYDFPEFEENTNTLRNVVIADYTGHQCAYCPGAAAEAESIAETNPERIFIASIHGSAQIGGLGDFQKTSPEYPRDLTNPQGLEMASTFFQLGVGFGGNPRGTVSRVVDDAGKFFLFYSNWSDKTNEVLASDLKVNIQAKSAYFPETNGVYLHIETEFIQESTGTYNIVIYALENLFVGPQLYFDGMSTYTIEDFEHHDIHRGNLFDETWGRGIASGTETVGTKIRNDFSYKLPDGLTNTDMHFLVIVYNRETYEIEQVIKHKF